MHRISQSLLDRLAEKTARCLSRHASAAGGRAVLAAVSGGADSTALALVLARLRALGRLRWTPWIGHVDHGVRPGSDADTRHVEALAAHLGIGFASRRLAFGAAGASEGDLRTARYAALAGIAADCGARLLLTAHHADDDVETVLFRLLRGTGPRGLAGIPAARRTRDGLLVVRPFLNVPRRALARLVAATGLAPRDDPTNRDLGRARNRIRHAVLPTLRARHGTAIERSLRAVARASRVLVDAVEADARRLLHERGRAVTAWRVELDLRGLGPAQRPALEDALRQLHTRLTGTAPTRAWLARALRLGTAPRGRRLQAFGDLLVERTCRGLLLVDRARAGRVPAGGCALALDAGPVRFGSTEWTVRADRCARSVRAPRVPVGTNAVARIDAAAAPGPWRLRVRRPAESIDRLDASGSTALRRQMQRLGIPRYDRDRLPVVVDRADRVLWAPGLEVAGFARARDRTDACVELRAATSCPVASGNEGPHTVAPDSP